MEYILYFVICLCTSIIGSISGIGGGVIIKPVLDSLGTMSVSVISFLSGITVLSMSAVSLMRRDKEVKPAPGIGLPLTIGASLGGIAGRSLFVHVCNLLDTQRLVGTIQAVVLLVMNLLVLVYFICKRKIQTKHVTNTAACLFIGAGLGVISSFLGIGGGPLNIAVLVVVFSLNAKQAAITSLFIIFGSQLTSLASSILSGTVPVFSWLTLLVMCLGGVVGAYIGQGISKKASQKAVEKTFLALLIFLIGLNIYNIIQFIGL